MGTKETGARPRVEQEDPLTLTLSDLRTLADKSRINLSISDYESYIGVYVSRGCHMSRYEWRKFTEQLKEVGFVHIGGGNPWYATYKQKIALGGAYHIGTSR